MAAILERFFRGKVVALVRRVQLPLVAPQFKGKGSIIMMTILAEMLYQDVIVRGDEPIGFTLETTEGDSESKSVIS